MEFTKSSENTVSEEDIKKTYKLLNHEQNTEVRLIDPKGKEKPITKNVSSEQELINICKKYNGSYNIYVGINERKANGTTKEDVLNTKLMVVDIDPIRKPNTASTKEELGKARQTTLKICSDLEKEGFKKPNVLMSGNGYQLWFSFPKIIIDDKNRQEINDKIQRVQDYFVQTYSNKDIKIDKIGDLPRIIKVGGTLSIKGDNTEERPMRKATWIEFQGRNEDPKLRDKILRIETKKTNEVDLNKLQANVETKYLFDEITKNDKMSKIFRGDTGDYKSRSEAEQTIVTFLVGLGATLNQVELIMRQGNTGKWISANLAYRHLTYEKAVKWVQANKNSEPNVDKSKIKTFDPKPSSFSELYEMTIPENDWLVDKWIPNKQIIPIVGRSGHNKTWVALEIGMSVALGDYCFGEWDTKKTKVLYLDDENGINILAKRAKLFPFNRIPEKDNFKFYSYSNFDLNKDECIAWLENEIKNGVGLVILDSFAGSHSLESENEAGTMRSMLGSTLGWLSNEYNVSFILVHHLRKSNASKGKWPIDYLEDMRGSSELRNYAQTILGVGKRDEDSNKFQLYRAKCKIEEPMKAHEILMDKNENGYIEFEDLGEEEEHVKADEKCIIDITNWPYIQDGKEFKRKELVEYLEGGYSRTILNISLKVAVEKGLLKKVKRGIYRLNNTGSMGVEHSNL